MFSRIACWVRLDLSVPSGRVCNTWTQVSQSSWAGEEGEAFDFSGFFFSASVNIYQCLRCTRYCTGNMYWKRQNLWSGSALDLCEKQVCQLESLKLGSNSPGCAGVCYTKWRPGTTPARIQMTRSPVGETAEFHLKKVDENNGYTKFCFFPGKLANEIQCQMSNLVQEACG